MSATFLSPVNMAEIIQLRISLIDSNPLIWRQVLISKSTTFFKLHQIIQIAMGWKSSHLFEFNLEGYRIGIIDEQEPGYGNSKVIDAKKSTLKDLISHEGETFKYLYDFGDNWQHVVEVEKFIDKEPDSSYPVCIYGALNCPPEDCGGIHSFYNLMKILGNKKHPDYIETVHWIGKNYNPGVFDKDKVNRGLKKMQSSR